MTTQPPLNTNRGIAWKCKGDYDFALKDLDEALRLRPNIHPPRYARGEIYLTLKEYDKALADANYGIKVGREYGGFWELGGDIRMAQKNYDKARSNYSEAILRDPKPARIYRKRGYVAQNRGLGGVR